jgi:bile acid:Na+ symporter, BASS family
MHPVDTLRIHFDPSQLIVLNIAMAFLMFSVALDIKLSDFRQVVRFPKAVFVGLTVQYLLFPLFTLALIYLFKPPISVAMGMVLVSMCPSGNMTNFLVHFSRSNIALSVTLNAIIILAASFITPAGYFGLNISPVPKS